MRFRVSRAILGRAILTHGNSERALSRIDVWFFFLFEVISRRSLSTTGVGSSALSFSPLSPHRHGTGDVRPARSPSRRVVTHTLDPGSGLLPFHSSFSWADPSLTQPSPGFVGISPGLSVSESTSALSLRPPLG